MADHESSAKVSVDLLSKDQTPFGHAVNTVQTTNAEQANQIAQTHQIDTEHHNPIQNIALYSAEDEEWMRYALAQAELAKQHGEVPVGAVIVHEGKIIGAGFNCPILQSDPTAHAEVQAIRQACQHIQNYRLPEQSTLYVTLEPCTQCVGALIHARIQRVVFAALEPRAGSLVSARQLLNQGFYNHYFEFVGGCLASESGQILKDFFKSRRAQKKSAKLDNSDSQI